LPAKPAAPPLLIYDGHCVLCTGLLGWLLPRIPTGALAVLPCTAPAALPYLQRALIDPAAPASVLLVDGESAEAVLSHARQTPTGQRLIWVGPDAPEHAWRVVDRPIRWSDVLHELEAVCAARQVDSGYLDLDFSSPAPLGLDPMEPAAPVRRALLVGCDRPELDLLRRRLASVGVADIDEVGNTESAVELVRRNHYVCAAFNLDEALLDAWALARLFAHHNPQSLSIGQSRHVGSQGRWWSRRRVMRDAKRARLTTVLPRPLQAHDLAPWLDLLRG